MWKKTSCLAYFVYYVRVQYMIYSVIVWFLPPEEIDKMYTDANRLLGCINSYKAKFHCVVVILVLDFLELILKIHF